jgi:hypothetical protein
LGKSHKLLSTNAFKAQGVDSESYWIPGSYAPALSEKPNSFLRLLKNRGFKEKRITKIRFYPIGTSTTLESNKSHCYKLSEVVYMRKLSQSITCLSLPLL